jgi:hypothetical protein
LLLLLLMLQVRYNIAAIVPAMLKFQDFIMSNQVCHISNWASTTIVKLPNGDRQG